MSKAIKVSVIGAGSAQFSLGLVKDLCLTEGLVNLEKSELSMAQLQEDHAVAAGTILFWYDTLQQ